MLVMDFTPNTKTLEPSNPVLGKADEEFLASIRHKIQLSAEDKKQLANIAKTLENQLSLQPDALPVLDRLQKFVENHFTHPSLAPNELFTTPPFLKLISKDGYKIFINKILWAKKLPFLRKSLLLNLNQEEKCPLTELQISTLNAYVENRYIPKTTELQELFQAIAS